MATLYMVGTPIGNLQDITLRALDTLKKVDIIACEDTRHTQKLLFHFEISKPLITVHAAREKENSAYVVKKMDAGENVAYVSDAGTPCLSDPGAMLASLAREHGHEVVPIPGPSAFATLLSVAGPLGKTVTFEGFLSPRPGRRRKRLMELMARTESALLYESPHRIIKLLEDIATVDPNRTLVIGRELTKIHEEIQRVSVKVLLDDFMSRNEIKGEIALIILPKIVEDDEEETT